MIEHKNSHNAQKSGQEHATFLYLGLKRVTCKFFSALFLLLVGLGPKRSMPIEKLDSSSLVSSIF